MRSQDELGAPAVRAGLRVRRCDDIDWDHRLWVRRTRRRGWQETPYAGPCGG
ncbi:MULTISPECIES: hypothetical protein [unclassified Streptomyces]|uniref:hypothetical protein n=1 Tax=unclassified Streptomyces TaxID=2593676 RepID=UPI000A6798A7|nr:hypothetical protein [Streptomyces sp. CB00316]